MKNNSTQKKNLFARFLFLLVLLVSAWTTQAQVSNYTFTQTTGNAYSPISGTFLSAQGVANDDNQYSSVPIGFSFTYNGTPYTTIGVNSNGYVALGGTAPGSFYNGTSIQNVANAIHAFSEDLHGTNAACNMQYLTTGSVGSRVFTLQWSNWGFYSTSSDLVNFQMKLFETSNTIQFCYGPLSITTAQTCQVGLTGATVADFNSRTTATNWTATTAAAVNTAQMTYSNVGPIGPTVGLAYTYTVSPLTSCATPLSQPTGLTTASTSVSISGTFTPASGSDSYFIVRYPSGASPQTAPVDGVTYAPGSALGLGTVVGSSSSPNFTALGLAASTTYDFYIYSMNSLCTGGPLYLTASPLTGSATTTAGCFSTANGGLWSNPATWQSGVAPLFGEPVTITSGSIVTVDAATNIGNLNVSGTLQWNGTANAMTVSGNVTINSGGKFLAYTTAAGGTTGVTVNVTGDFTNNGYANFAIGTTTNAVINFNGAGSNLGGTGTWEGDGTNGIIRALLFGTTGANQITTSMNIVTYNFAHANSTINTNGKIIVDNTKGIFGRPYNTTVASVHVTTMGSLYSVAPVVFGSAVTQWTASGTATANSRYFNGNNVYLVTTGGTFGASAPVNTSPVTETNGTATVVWVGTLGTIGNPIPVTAVTVGTQYFCGNNLYTCIVAGTPTAATLPTCLSGTCVSGTATFRYAGSPAQVTVNYDGTTQTVRSLSITSNGTGYSSSAAPAITFSVGVFGGTGSGAVATAVINYAIFGATVSQVQRSGNATFTGGITINSDQGTSVATSNTQASSGVGFIYTTNGGTNYTVAPSLAFGGPLALNLITNPGSGYTVAPTITVSGGTLIAGGTAYTSASFVITVNQGQVESVYLTATTASYIVPPTLTMSAPGAGTTATLAFPAGCWPAATPVIGSNGQILSFTITNAGYGYNTAPLTAVGTSGTFTTAATAPITRLGQYQLILNWFAPSTTAVVAPDDATIPTNRKMSALQLNGNGNGLTLTGGNLTLYGTAPLALVASLSTPGNILNLNGNNLKFTWNSYAGLTTSSYGGSSSNGYVKNGSITMTGRGGASTFNFPFAGLTTTGSLVWFAGSTPTAVTTGSTATNVTIAELGAPSNASYGNGASTGNRTYRVQLNSGAITGLNPTIKLCFNSLDGLTTTQDQLFTAESNAQSGPYTLRSAAYGVSGALPATGFITSATTGNGPIQPTTDRYYAFALPATVVSTFLPASSCGGGNVVITGSGFTGATAVSFGGTPALSFVVNSNTQITAVVSNTGSSGVVSVTSPAGTGTSAGSFTYLGVGPVVSILQGSNIVICPSASQLITALPTGSGETYQWDANGGNATTQSITVSPTVPTTYSCVVTNLSGCSNTVSASVTISTPPSLSNISATPSTICFGSTSQLDAGTFVSGTITTATAGGNGSSCNGMDIQNVSSVGVTLHFLSFQSSSSVGTVGLESIYYNPTPMNCVFPANVTTAPGWILLGSVNTTSAGSTLGTLTQIPLNINITIPAGATYAFAFGGALGVTYTNGAGGCITNASNAYLNIKEGFGGTLTGTIATRKLNGSFTYDYGDPTLTYAWTPAASLTNAAILNPVASPTTTTTYSLTATNAANCSTSATVPVTVLPLPTAPTISGTNVFCGTANVTLNSSAPTGGNTIDWYSAPTGGALLNTGTTYNITGLAVTTTYYVQETGTSCNSPRTPYTVTINTPPTLTVNLTGTTPYCANAPNTITLAATGGIYNNFSWLPTAGITSATNLATITASPTATTTYTVTATDINGCTAVVPASVITVQATPTVVLTATPTTTCAGGTSLLSTVSAPAGAAPTSNSAYTISSIPFAAVLPSGSTNPGPAGDDVLSGAIPIGFPFSYYGTTYTNVYISTNGFMSFDATAGAGCCTGQVLPSTTAPNNVIALDWMDLNTANGGNIDYFNLTSPNRFVIRFNAVATFSSTGTVSGEIILYENNYVEIHMSSITTAGTAQTQGIENAGGTLATPVTGRNSTAWNATNEAYKFFQNNTALFNYSWAPVLNTTSSVSVNPTITTTYTVNVQEIATGCINTQTTTVTIIPLVAGTASITGGNCGNGNITLNLTGNTPGAGIQWEEGPVGGPYSPITGATTANYPYVQTLPLREYRAVVTCAGSVTTNTVQATITFAASLGATPSAVCGQQISPAPVITFTATPTGGSGSFQYSWVGYNVVSVNNPVTTTNLNQVGSYTYTAQILDLVTQCSVNANSVVTGNPSPVVTATATPSTICAGTTSQLQTTNNIVGNSYNVSSITYAPVSSGSPITGITGDDAVSGAVALPWPFPFFGSTYSNIYMGTNGFVTFNAASGSGCCSGGVIPSAAILNNYIAIAWNDLNVLGGTNNIQYYSLTSPNRFVIEYNNVIQFGGAGGPLTGQIILYQSGMIDILISAVQSDGSTQTEGIQDATGANGYAVTGRNSTVWSVTTPDAYRFTPVGGAIVWSPGATLSSTTINNPVATPTANTLYTAVVTNTGTGCYNSASTLVTVTPAPTGVISGGSTVCGGQSSSITVQLTGTGPWSYTVYDGTNSVVHTSQMSTSTFSVTPSGTTTYTLTAVSDQSGCTGTFSGSALVTVNPQPVGGTTDIGGQNSTVLCAGGGSAVINLSGSVGSIVWQQATTSNGPWTTAPGSTNSTTYNASVTATTYFRALLSNTSCYDVASTTVVVYVNPASMSVTSTLITDHTATITWSPYSANASYTVSYNGSGGPVSIPGAVSPLAISGLAGGTLINVTVTQDIPVCGVTGNTSFTTMCSAPTGLVLSNPTSNGFTATWTAVPGATGYQLYYRGVAGNLAWSSVTTTNTTYTFPTPSLVPNAAYSVYVVSLGCGSGSYPSAQQAISTTGTSCGAPTITATSGCANQITINVTAGAGTSIYYTFRKIYPVVGAWYGYTSNLTTYTATLPGLPAGGEIYEVWARNVCTASPLLYSPASNQQIVTTPLKLPAPNNVVISQPTCNGFTVAWNAVAGATGYQVYYKKSTATNYSGYAVGLSTVFTFHTLTTGNYNVYVVALGCNNLQGASSAIINTNTQTIGCRSAQDNSVLAEQSSSLDNSTLNVFPNPNDGQFSVEMTLDNDAPVTLEVINVLGQVIYSSVPAVNNNFMSTVVNLKDSAAGIYYVRITQNGVEYLRRVMVAN